jgi:hypothetical protein
MLESGSSQATVDVKGKSLIGSRSIAYLQHPNCLFSANLVEYGGDKYKTMRNTLRTGSRSRGHCLSPPFDEQVHVPARVTRAASAPAEERARVNGDC